MRMLHKIKIIGCSIITILLCTSCSLLPSESVARETSTGTGFVKSEAGYYDSADTAILVGKNEEESTVTFLNIQVGKNYTLK